MSERQEKVLAFLREHNIPFSCYEHPEGKTIEEAKRWWRQDGSVHCKNIFMRNHKGNQHYLICFHCDHDLDIHDLEARLKAALQAQGKPSCGKLSFASPERMMKYLGLEPGSVSPFGLINDREHHVHLFLDAGLLDEMSILIGPGIDGRKGMVSVFDGIPMDRGPVTLVNVNQKVSHLLTNF